MTAITSATPKLEAALAYVAHGWHAFILSSSKSPLRNCEMCATEHVTTEQREACTCLTCHGFYAATPDPARIAEMLRRHPNGLIAVRTGAVSGIAVVDIDPPAGTATSARLDEAGVLPGTVTAATGRGAQLVYAHPGGKIKSGAGLLGPGVDSKADGGYIVVAPSIHPKSRSPYRWIGDRFDLELTPLHPRIVAHLREKPPAAPSVTSPRRGDDNVHGRLRGLVDVVLRSTEGGRNSALNWAAHKAGEMVARGELDERTAFDVLHDAATYVGLTPSEIGRDSGHGTIGSGLRAGMRAC
ncbi:bifunctional DNA primase/polymerase [Streptosporangium sp. DT93]|uniref:bifunctional DNA primase/polymerase n=1 Tax=Streptosporangium sp. DT93 TaxID=3393428 RepID=UPI003CE6FDEB